MGILDDAIREHLELKRRHGADSTEVARQEREILGNEDAAPAPAAGDPLAAFNPAEEALAPGVLEDDEPLPAEPLAGSPLAEPEPPAATGPVDDLFPGTGELLAAASEPAPPPPAAPAAALPEPAPADADSETVARSGARRLSDEDLAAWRRRLSERADRLAAQRPGTEGAAEPPAAPAPAAPKEEPPAYWSGREQGTPPPPPEPGVPVDFFDAGDAERAFSPEAAPEPELAPDLEHDVLDETPEFLEETPEHDRMWFEQKPPRDFDFG